MHLINYNREEFKYDPGKEMDIMENFGDVEVYEFNSPKEIQQFIKERVGHREDLTVLSDCTVLQWLREVGYVLYLVPGWRTRYNLTVFVDTLHPHLVNYYKKTADITGRVEIRNCFKDEYGYYVCYNHTHYEIESYESYERILPY
jgi:hypothetical protein